MKITVIGAGAMGLLFYQQLKGKNQVNLLSRGAKHLASTFSFTRLDNLSTLINLVHAQEIDLLNSECVLCCVKSYDLPALIVKINAINPKLPIILMHNGMGVLEQTFKTHTIYNPIYTLLTTQASKKSAAWHIRHTGQGYNHLGNAFNPLDEQASQKLFNAFTTSLEHCEIDDNIRQKQWQKLAINCAINALTAIENVQNGALAQTKYQPTIMAVIDELVLLANKENVCFDKDQLMTQVHQVISLTAKNSSSMREDVLKGRKTEIDYINGYISQLGQKHDCPTPINDLLTAKIRHLTKHA
ncbi:ketopantoate reductase family protein [Thalassotalea aquiviva]|uniref:ketopantoate reductase family protein n=1 Tax=Thalassotalea aquiviva TaxID=3242415 RepID=UPI00352AE905